MIKVFGIILSAALIFQCPEQKNKNYIAFEFTSEHTEKPISVIIFNIDSMTTDKFSFSGYKFKVTKKEFNDIQDAAKHNCSYLLLDSLAYAYYSVNVVKNGTRTIYGTINRN